MLKLASELHEKREKAARKFEKEIESNLKAVALEKARFEVRIEPPAKADFIRRNGRKIFYGKRFRSDRILFFGKRRRIGQTDCKSRFGRRSVAPDVDFKDDGETFRI